MIVRRFSAVIFSTAVFFLVTCVPAAASVPKDVSKLTPYLVKIRIFLKKDPEEKGRQGYGRGYGFRNSFLNHYIEKEQSLNGSGVIVDVSGTVVTGDMSIQERMIDRIEVETLDGKQFTARRKYVLLNGPGLILEPEKPLDKPLKAVSFAAWRGMPDEIFAVALREWSGEWRIGTVPLQKTFVYDVDDSLRPFYGAGGGGNNVFHEMMWAEMRSAAQSAPEAALVIDGEEAIHGILLGARLDPEEKETPWRGENVLAKDNRLSIEDLEIVKKRIQDQYADSIVRIKLEFRKDKAGNRNTGFGLDAMMWMVPGAIGPKGTLQDLEVYGLTFTPDQIFVPVMITRAAAAKIEKIKIGDDGNEVEGKFVGAFEDFSGFIVQRKEGNFPRHTVIEPRPLPRRGRLFLAASVEQKFGGRKWEFIHERRMGWKVGYKNRRYPTILTPPPPGSFLFDLEGNLLGFFTRELTGKEEEKSFNRTYGYSVMGSDMNRVYDLAETSGILLDPEEHFNPNIQHLAEEEEKRIPWLGVEYTTVTPDLARAMKIDKPTKDGTIGLLVSYVYPDSPAARLGIAEKDVLISIRRETEETPIELAPGSSRYDFDWDFGEFGMEREYDIQIQKMKRSWRPRKNYLTLLMLSIGSGKKISLSYFHDGRTVESNIELELSPRDFESARKHKDEQLGITIKELTYEVRKALNLEKDAPGVVVAKVEPGGPAGVAKIRMYEIITKVEGEPVTSVDNFFEHIKKAQASGGETVVVTILSIGKYRIADLGIGSR